MLRTRTRPIHNLRSVQNADGTHTISGYAALYNVLSEELAPGVRERLAPGCFDTAVASSDIRCLYNHDSNFLLGRQSNSTLTVKADQLGLYYECQVPDTSYAKDIAVLMERGDLKENSFAFTVSSDNIDVEQSADGGSIETIRSVDELFDVSIVVRPAYPQTFSVYRHVDLMKQASESRTAEETNTASKQTEVESRTADADVDLALAKLTLQSKQLEAQFND